MGANPQSVGTTGRIPVVALGLQGIFRILNRRYLIFTASPIPQLVVAAVSERLNRRIGHYVFRPSVRPLNCGILVLLCTTEASA
jgi:hypothetical protein